jgi:predicted transcriptional regulator
MAAKPGGRPSEWITNRGRVRTPLGHRLVMLVDEHLKAHGLTRSDKGAVRQALEQIRRKPPYDKWTEIEPLRQGFYAALKATPPPEPPADPQDHCASLLQKWGAANARQIINQLATLARPERMASLVERFDALARSNRRPEEKVAKVLWWVSKMEEDPGWFPSIRRDRTAARDKRWTKFLEAIKAAGTMSVEEFRCHFDLTEAAANGALQAMLRAKMINRVSDGVYSVGPGDRYTRNTVCVLALMIEHPGIRCKEMEARLNLGKAAVRGAIESLRRMGIADPQPCTGNWSKTDDGRCVRLGAPPVLSASAREAVRHGEIRDGRGGTLWKRPEPDQTPMVRLS